MARSLLRTLYSTSRTLSTVVKDARRAQQIGGILARHGLGALVARGERPEAAGEAAARAEVRAEVLAGLTATDGPRAGVAARLVDMLEELGPTFVKFGQILSTRPDLVPPDFIARLQSLQDHVAEVPLDDVRRQIEQSLKAPPEALFRSFDPAPLASASIAQVHAATLADGTEVVVKVQRPGLKPVIEADLSLLRFIVGRVREVFPEVDAFDVDGMVRAFERSLLAELDFVAERRNIERFQRNFHDKPHIHIPQVFPALCASAVLTMERIRGVKLTALSDEATRKRTAGLYLDAAYQMLFRDGFFHGDLHPGNVFWEERTGRLGLIDFGMVGRLGRSHRERLVDVIFALLTEDLGGVARVWAQVGRPQGQLDFGRFEAAITEVLELHIVGRSMDEWDLGAFFRELALAALQHGVRLPSDFTMMFKAMATTEGLARTVAAGINPVEAARPYIEALIADRTSPQRLQRLAVGEGVRLLELARSLPHTVERVVDRVERGELTVRLRHEAVEPEVTRVVRALNRTAVALVSAAASLTGALTADRGPHLWLGLSPLSVIAFGIAAAGLAWIVAGVVRGR